MCSVQEEEEVVTAGENMQQLASASTRRALQQAAESTVSGSQSTSQPQQGSDAPAPEAPGLSSGAQQQQDDTSDGESSALAPATVRMQPDSADTSDITADSPSPTADADTPAAVAESPGDSESDFVFDPAKQAEAPSPAPASETDIDDLDLKDVLEAQPTYTEPSESNQKGKIVRVSVLIAAGVVAVAMAALFMYHHRSVKPLPGGGVQPDRTACTHSAAEGLCLTCGTMCCIRCSAY